ncbi:hypothetical protein V2J09_011874 [Rumex salicifolius]
MSMEMASERVCYVHCNFCNTILAVSIPSSNLLLTIVTVRCGHCSNLLTVNLTSPPPQNLPRQQAESTEEMMMISKLSSNYIDINTKAGSSSSSSSNASKTITATSFESADQNHPPRTPPIRPPEKKPRVPSAYNKFIKEEIQRVKAINPEITHREAFSLAAKNWAHFPRIHFGLNLEGQKQANQKNPGLY